MRKQLVRTVEDLMRTDPRVVVMLGDIGVFGFRNAFRLYPDRIYNVGICEQSMTSMAAGLAKIGLVPILHSIAPFVVERCFEQLKVDLGYQGLNANIVSVGGSYDYAALGCTHHCPGDVALVKTIPGFRVLVPGSDRDFDTLLRESYANSGAPNYYRLTEQGHSVKIDVQFGKGQKVKDGQRGTVVVIGPLLERTIEACMDLDVTILYYTTVIPFDTDILRANIRSDRVALIEPFYEGTLSYEVLSSLAGKNIKLMTIGVPRRFLTNYGKVGEHDEAYGLTPIGIKRRLEEFIR